MFRPEANRLLPHAPTAPSSLFAGTLTQNRMGVVEGWFGGLDSVFSTDRGHVNSVPPALTHIVRDHLSINSTAVIMINEKGSKVCTGMR